MKKALIGVLTILMLFAMCNIAMAWDPAQELESQQESGTPDAKYWFPHYLLAPGDIGWSDSTSGNAFTINYPPGQPTFTVTSNTTQIVSNGIVRKGSTTWMGDIFLAVETNMTVKYYYEWWPYVNIPGAGNAKVPYMVKWVGEPWDANGYWKLLNRLDP